MRQIELKSMSFNVFGKVFKSNHLSIFMITGLLFLHATLHAQLDYRAKFAPVAPVVDGIGNEEVWSTVEWFPINVEWFTNAPPCPPDDFSGKFKAVWTTERLYLLVEIVDDVLRDSYTDPLVKYWEDDCLEVFIDEDRSGGDHKYNYNAFAYHISAVYKDIVDIGTDRKAHLYNDHAIVEIKKDGTTYTWEIAFLLYGNDFVLGGQNTPKTLYEGKKMGFTMAYCDDDGNDRENFIGTEPGGLDSWINASLFGRMELVAADPPLYLPDANHADDWAFFPNPVRDHLTIMPPPANSKSYNIELFDISGKLLNSNLFDNSNHEQIIDLPKEYSGKYIILRLKSDDSVRNFKILRE